MPEAASDTAGLEGTERKAGATADTNSAAACGGRISIWQSAGQSGATGGHKKTSPEEGLSGAKGARKY